MLVAEKVMGFSDVKWNSWSGYHGKSPEYRQIADIPDYSTDNTAVWEVVEKLRQDGFTVVVAANFQSNLQACMIFEGVPTMAFPPKDVFLHLAEEAAFAVSDVGRRIGAKCVQTQAKTAPLAICLAALEVVQ